ncbi:hypothetical protein L7F22_030526 [Adiantum nelumboides]|nr:hypothetical protein [Adiantum nelumboides]
MIWWCVIDDVVAGEHDSPVFSSSFSNVELAKAEEHLRKHHHATVHSIQYAIGQLEQTLHGISAVLSLWNPRVTQPLDTTTSQLWLMAGNFTGSHLDIIEAGWKVSCPYIDQFFGFILSNSRLCLGYDNYEEIGCIDLHCPGFVQVSNVLALGATIAPPFSTYQGAPAELGPINLSKDPTTGDWWLTSGFTAIGYWPKGLFQNGMQEGAAQYGQWGGQVLNTWTNGQHTDTQMGSGHFASEGLYHASYHRNLISFDENDTMNAPDMDAMRIYTTNPSCYTWAKGTIPAWSSSFFFGGPGRNPNCP